MKVEPQKEHDWLRSMLGEWTFEAEALTGPGQPPMRSEGNETVRSLGGLWVLAEGTGTMPDGAPATTLMTLGYDTVRKKYLGTWVGSMMSYLWQYNGTLDANGRTLTLDTEGPNFAEEGKLAKFQDIIEIWSDDHRVLSSRMLGADGKWHQFMTSHYRKKA